MKKILSSLLLMTVLFSILSLPVEALAHGSCACYTSWSAWSDWSETKREASDTVDVQCKTTYHWWAAKCNSCGTHNPYWGSSTKCKNCGKYLPRKTFTNIDIYTENKPTMKSLLGRKGITLNGKNYWGGDQRVTYRYRTRSVVYTSVKKVDFALSGISKNSTVKLVVNSTLTLNPRMKTYYTDGTNTGWVDMKNGNGVLFSSSNTNVAWVSSTGKITAYKEGSATITVTRNGYSDQVKFTLKVTAPSAPSIQSICGSGCQVSLSWKKIDGVKDYEIQYEHAGPSLSTAATGTWDNSCITTGTSLTVTSGLKLGVKYAFRVRARYMNGGRLTTTAWSSTKYITLKKPGTPSIKSLSTSDTRVIVTINPVAGASYYEIDWDKSGQPFWRYGGTTGSTTLRAADGLVAGKKFAFRVRAVYWNGVEYARTAWSATNYITVKR